MYLSGHESRKHRNHDLASGCCELTVAKLGEIRPHMIPNSFRSMKLEHFNCGWADCTYRSTVSCGTVGRMTLILCNWAEYTYINLLRTGLYLTSIVFYVLYYNQSHAGNQTTTVDLHVVTKLTHLVAFVYAAIGHDVRESSSSAPAGFFPSGFLGLVLPG